MFITERHLRNRAADALSSVGSPQDLRFLRGLDADRPSAIIVVTADRESAMLPPTWGTVVPIGDLPSLGRHARFLRVRLRLQRWAIEVRSATKLPIIVRASVATILDAYHLAMSWRSVRDLAEQLGVSRQYLSRIAGRAGVDLRRVADAHRTVLVDVAVHVEGWTFD